MVEYPEGLLAIFLSVFIFIGSIYVLVALNTGWRFGYWVTGASLGGLMVFMSLFWALRNLGPAVVGEGIAYLVASVAWLLFHLWGLNRAERKKTSPVAD